DCRSCLCARVVLFFFSIRRRHTRSKRDWSSDVCSSDLAGAVTAVTGPIAFVGLVVPHLCRLLAGPDHRWLLPLSALGGGILLTAAAILGRVVARPEEVDVGILVAIVGAPFFIAIVRRQRMREL